MGVALVIRDGSPNWWESPDIWVVPGPDPNGVPGTPVVGQQAFLWANVSNQGRHRGVWEVQVDFWIADPSMQIRKSTSNHIGTAFRGCGRRCNPTGALPGALERPLSSNGGHECAVVEASSPP